MAYGTRTSVFVRHFVYLVTAGFLAFCTLQAAAQQEQSIPVVTMWPGPDLPTPRTHLGVCATGGKLYTIAGAVYETGSGQVQRAWYLDVVEIYDPDTGSWTTGTPLPTARSSAAVAAINGKIFVAGGFNGEILGTLDIYDPVTDTWSRGADMPVARSDASAVAAGGKLYVIGGTDGVTGPVPGPADHDERPGPEVFWGRNDGWFGSNLLSVYDPATNTWSDLTPMPTARTGAAAGVINGKIHVAGGSIGSRHVATLEIYDIASGTWGTGPDMPTSRSECAASVVGVKLIVTGGIDKVAFEVFHTAADQWLREPDMTVVRRGHDCAVIDGEMYIVGGDNGEGPVAAIHICRP